MLDFIKEIFSSFRRNSLERIKSPFLGAFVFSWLSFNWQLVAVLSLSKENILTRINYINENFGIETLLIGPTFTTLLICILLPTANKFITIMQKSTNHDTNILILQSRIDIAEKQLEIADYEAKKKLSEEREKKNIEADINSIISTRDQYIFNFKEAQKTIYTQKKDNDNLISNEIKANAKISELQNSCKSLGEEITEQKSTVDKLRNEIARILQEANSTREDLKKITSESMKTALKLNEVTEEKLKLSGELKALKDQNKELKEDSKSNSIANHHIYNSDEFKGLKKLSELSLTPSFYKEISNIYPAYMTALNAIFKQEEIIGKTANSTVMKLAEEISNIKGLNFQNTIPSKAPYKPTHIKKTSQHEMKNELNNKEKTSTEINLIEKKNI